MGEEQRKKREEGLAWERETGAKDGGGRAAAKVKYVSFAQRQAHAREKLVRAPTATRALQQCKDQQ